MFAGAAALAVLAAGAGAAAAQSTTVSSSTGSCPSQQSVMTTTSAQGTNGYICAQEYHDGDRSIGPLATQTFSQDTNVAYFPMYYCWDSSDDKDFTYAHAEIFGSGSVSATNWGTGSHVWGAGYLYTLGATSVSGWSAGCNDSASVWSPAPSILTLSSITASGLPNNGASVAGQPYQLSVHVDPANKAAGYNAAVQDNGVTVGGAVMDSNGNATITWTPALMGSRTIQVVWPGMSSAVGNRTDAYTVNVSGGTSLAISPTVSYSPTTGLATATVTMNTAPNPIASSVPMVLKDVSTSPPTTLGSTSSFVAGSTTSTSGNATISFPVTLGKSYKLMAFVGANASSNPPIAAGQSYALTYAAPKATTTSTTFPSSSNTIYVGSKSGYTGGCATVALPTSVSASSATGTVTASGSGSTSRTLSNGSATPGWCPPSSPGTYSANVTYSGDNANAASISASGSIKVVSGGPTNVTSLAPSAVSYSGNNANMKTTVTVSGWSGSGTTQMIDGKSGQVFGTGTLSGGSGTLNFTIPMYTKYNLTALFIPNGSVQSFPAPAFNNYEYFPPGALERTPRRVSHEAAGASETARRGRESRGGKAKRTTTVGVQTGTQSIGSSRRVTSRSRSITLSCPKGTYVLHADGASGGPATRLGVSTSGRKVTITSPASNVGARMSAQAFCRQDNMGMMIVGYKAYGTRGPDLIRSGVKSGLAFAGPGPDRVALTGAGSMTWGGPGSDRIIVQGKDSSSHGGPGRDRIVAKGTARTMVIGGPGRDVLIGGKAVTHINAQDGNPGDRIICRSSKNVVMLDVGDITSGPCQVVGAS